MSSPERGPEIQPMGVLFNGRLSAGGSLDWSLSEAEPMPTVDDNRLLHQRAIDIYHDIKRRASPEGIMLGGAISGISIALYPGIEAAIIPVVREAMTIIPQETLKPSMALTLGVANVGGIAIEALTLRRKQAAATVWGPMALVITNDLFAATADYIISNALMIAVNPFSAIAVYAGDNPLLLSVAAATSLAHVAWATVWNAFIALGVADTPISLVKNTRETFWNKIKRKTTQEETID